jgi:hypothetical protein
MGLQGVPILSRRMQTAEEGLPSYRDRLPWAMFFLTKTVPISSENRVNLCTS